MLRAGIEGMLSRKQGEEAQGIVSSFVQASMNLLNRSVCSFLVDEHQTLNPSAQTLQPYYETLLEGHGT